MRRTTTGWFFTVTGFLACPCHLVITLPLAAALLSGTALGGWIATHQGAIFVGASIYFIGALVHLINSLILVLNGTLIPVELYPGCAQAIARLLPTTLGIEATWKVVLQGQSLGAAWAAGTLPWLVVHAVGLAALGWLIFLVNDRRAMERGTLG